MHTIPLKYCGLERRLEWAKASICLMSPMIWVWFPGPTTGENGLQHCPWCQRDTQDVHLNLQQEPDGGVESAQPLLSERRQVQLAVSLICTLSVVSQALQPPAGLGAFLDLLRVMGGQMRHFGAARFYSFFPFPSGDDLALYHRLLCHADCAMCWKQHLW